MSDHRTDAEQAIHEVNQQLMEAIVARDAAAVLDCYSDDGVLLPAGGTMARGREALQATWEGLFAAGVERIELRTEELSVMDDSAYEIGTATVHIRPPGQDPIQDPGKYVVIWKRQNGKWKLYADIFNSDSPPPQ